MPRSRDSSWRATSPIPAIYLAEYVEHYHHGRNHQGIGNELIEPIPANTNAGEGVVRRRARLGGLLSYYHREAA
jgi:hypothetical protein